jgi:hypothetical protein
MPWGIDPELEDRTMAPIEAYAWAILGVLISFVLPPLMRAAGVAQKVDPTASVSAWWPRVKTMITGRAAAVSALSAILALLVVAVLGDEISTWRIALISGLGWQSILARTLAPGS